jgi:hypothetical protein
MLRINDTIFSFDILEKKFVCDLSTCNGNCCRYGDSGAPLSNTEAIILNEIWPLLKPYLRQEGINAIEREGASMVDFQNELVTPLIGNEECAYTVMDGTIFKCGIENAWKDGKISFRKPISCHLFPIRIKHFSSFKGVNYEELSICNCARQKGSKEGIFVYEFLKEPLIRAVGIETYDELCIAATELRRQGKRKEKRKT